MSDLTPTVSYSIENDAAFRAAIERAEAEVGDLTIPFKLITGDFYRSERPLFELKGPGQYPDFGGLHSTPKKAQAARQAKIRAVGFAYPLLVREGPLRDSLTNPDDPNAINFISSGGRSLTLGTRVPYAIFHQSDAARKKIPQRKVLFIGPEAPRFATSDQVGRLDRWTHIIEGYVESKLRQLGEVQ